MKDINVKIQNELVAGEVVRTVVNPSKWLLAPSLVFLVLVMFKLLKTGMDGVTFLILVLALVFLVKGIIYLASTQLAITNKRVIIKTGLLFVNMDEIKSDKVESVNVNQSMTDRLFNIGSILVTGAGSKKMGLRGIANPRIIKNTIYGE